MRGWSLIVVLAFGPGCAAQRLVAPDRPPMPASPADLTDVTVALRSFTVENESEADREHDGRREMERAFVGYLTQGALLKLFVRTGFRYAKIAPDAVTLDVSLHVDHSDERTYVLDGLFFYPFCGLLPLTPQWGDATVDLTVNMSEAGEKEPPIRMRVVAPYSMIFYSWYRVAPIEDAFKRAHETAFREVTQRVIDRLVERKRRRLELARLEMVKTASVATSTAPAVEKLLASAVVQELPAVAPVTRREPTAAEIMRTFAPVEQVSLDPEGVSIISRPFSRKDPPDFLERYVGALGGLEASLTGGSAHVESRATTASGIEQTLGSGNARSRGYSVALYKPPDRSGFFFPPVIGFLSQEITISGFREDVPVFVAPGSNTVPAVVSDPSNGGAPVDITEAIDYQLKLKSGFIGQGIGLNMVIGTEDVQLFGTARAGINLVEFRYTDILIYKTRVTGTSWAAFQSGSLGGQLGIAFPSLHAAIRGAFNYQWYNDFNFPRRVDFLASYAFNPEKMMNERQKIFVDGAALQTLDWQISLIALF